MRTNPTRTNPNFYALTREHWYGWSWEKIVDTSGRFAKQKSGSLVLFGTISRISSCGT